MNTKHVCSSPRRLFNWAEGGISRLSQLTGMSQVTITQGLNELRTGRKLRTAGEGVRQPGGGRKKVEQADPNLPGHLKTIVEATTAGDPMSPLRWTSKSTRTIAQELSRAGHPISSVTVGRCLEEMGYPLQANVKAREGSQHPNRDAQFRYLNRQVKAFRRAGDPVISVDTKKKELIGEYKNAGSDYRPQGAPIDVNVHDFVDKELGKAIPYGVYDIGANAGCVSVGIDHDTAEFAVNAIRRWLAAMGRERYPTCERLMITADGGGSNGSRVRLWKIELQKLADETGLTIGVCHYPPGTSKWNKIEHRLFCHITQNWRGRPLTSRTAVVELIAATTTKTGLTVRCELDENTYAKGVKVSDAEMAALNISGDAFHPEWNYTIAPRPTPDST